MSYFCKSLHNIHVSCWRLREMSFFFALIAIIRKIIDQSDLTRDFKINWPVYTFIRKSRVRKKLVRCWSLSKWSSFWMVLTLAPCYQKTGLDSIKSLIINLCMKPICHFIPPLKKCIQWIKERNINLSLLLRYNTGNELGKGFWCLVWSFDFISLALQLKKTGR